MKACAKLLSIDSFLFIFKEIFIKVKFTLEILKLLGVVSFQKYPQQMRKALFSK